MTKNILDGVSVYNTLGKGNFRPAYLIGSSHTVLFTFSDRICNICSLFLSNC